MPTLDSTGQDPLLDAGYSAVPIQAAEAGASVRLCVVFRHETDPVSGHFVPVRRMFNAEVLLGCLADSANRPIEWVELWLQTAIDTGGLHAGYVRDLTNAALDNRWRETVEDFRALDGEGAITVALENRHPLPVLIDPAASQPTHPADGVSAIAWQLCKDDALLQQAGLPAYNRSLSRYLHVPGASGGKFIPVTVDSERNAATVEIETALPEIRKHVPFNLACGLVMVRRFSPLSLEDFADLLGGKAWHGVENAKKAFHFGGAHRLLEDETALRSGAHLLFAASKGISARLIEALHLKLQLFLETCRIVRADVRRAQLPLLNVSAETFRVRLGEVGFGLPLLWTFKAAMATPGQAYALPIRNSRVRHFQSVEPTGPSIYRPGDLAIPREGIGSVRVRKVAEVQDGCVIEATLTAQERFGEDESALLWVRLGLPGGKIDLYGFHSRTQAMAAGETAFKTLPLELPKATVAELQSVAGVPFTGAPFAVLPPLSTPCDLYSLAVLALRIFIVHSRNALPQALDAALSLARQLEEEGDTGEPLGARIARLATDDPRWLESLGPQHLRHEEIASSDALACMPPGLWWDILAIVLQFFPGIGQISFCRGWGSAPSLALDAIFEQPIAELERLAIHSRALVALDWSQNREIAEIIRGIEQSY